MKKMGRGMAYLFFIVMAYVLTGLLLLVLAFLLWRFQISEKMVGAGIILIYVTATFAAGFLAGKKAKSRKWAWGFLMGLGYFFILAGMSLLFDDGGKNMNFVSAFLLCSGGGMLGGMFS